MTKACALQWQKIPVSLAELCLDTTLRCGQSFRYIVQSSYLFSMLIMDPGGENLKMMSGLVHFMDV